MSATLHSLISSGRAVGKRVKHYSARGVEYLVVQVEEDFITLHRCPSKHPREMEISREAAMIWTEVEK